MTYRCLPAEILLHCLQNRYCSDYPRCSGCPQTSLRTALNSSVKGLMPERVGRVLGRGWVGAWRPAVAGGNGSLWWFCVLLYWLQNILEFWISPLGWGIFGFLLFPPSPERRQSQFPPDPSGLGCTVPCPEPTDKRLLTLEMVPESWVDPMVLVSAPLKTGPRIIQRLPSRRRSWNRKQWKVLWSFSFECYKQIFFKVYKKALIRRVCYKSQENKTRNTFK